MCGVGWGVEGVVEVGEVEGGGGGGGCVAPISKTGQFNWPHLGAAPVRVTEVLLEGGSV